MAARVGGRGNRLWPSMRKVGENEGLHGEPVFDDSAFIARREWNCFQMDVDGAIDFTYSSWSVITSNVLGFWEWR